MKVLIFTSLYPNNIFPHYGVFIKERMTHFAKLDGCSGRVVAPVPYFPPMKMNWRWVYSQVARREIIEGLEVRHPRYFMIPKFGMSLYGLKMFLSAVLTVRKMREDFDFDLIDAHYVYPDGFAAVLLGRFFKRPVVVSARGTDINLYTKFPLIRRLVQYTLDRSNQIIAVCHALKEAMVDLGIPEEKIIVVPNGVDVRKFFPMDKNEARKRLGLPLDKKIILSVGGLIPRKGFDFLGRALKILVEDLRVKNLNLIIVGEGPSRKELERLFQDLGLAKYVLLAGVVPHQELYVWYSAADLFCLTSSREGWPNVIMESLACGTPVVATNVWGIPEIISSKGMGILAERTEQDIARKISIALKQSWNREEIVKFAQRHTWDRVALQVYDVFKSVLNNSRPSKLMR